MKDHPICIRCHHGTQLEAPSKSLGLSPQLPPRPASYSLIQLPWDVTAWAEMQSGPLWVAWSCAGTLTTEDGLQLLQHRHLMPLEVLLSSLLLLPQVSPKSCKVVIFGHLNFTLREESSTEGLRITAFSIKVPGDTLTAAFYSGADVHFGCDPSYSPCLPFFHWHHGIDTKHWKRILSQLKGPGRCSLGAHLVKCYH